MKTFVPNSYLKVLRLFLQGVSPANIREAHEGFIPEEQLTDYLADISKRYADVIKWEKED